MENKLSEIQECRNEVQELTRRVNELSARIDRLAGEEAAYTLPVMEQYAPPAEPAVSQAPQPEEREDSSVRQYQNLENTVGKNLFAVLASLLVLLGVGVFISTIYEQIPEFVKILAIYIFGFALLGCGLVLYRKNNNNFWLGVASCGMAELLVSVITSHSYFEVLSLPAAFGLILVWIVGSFWLTKIQPTVFKTIGYIGFTISIMLGLSLLTDRDLAVYLTLLVSFGVLSVFFMVLNGGLVKMNTVLAFANVLNLCQFLNMRWYLPEDLHWLSGIIAGVILAVFHVIYLLRAKLYRDAYPFFCVVSFGVLAVFLNAYEMAVIIPVILCTALALWVVNYSTVSNGRARLVFSGFAAVYLFFMAYLASHGNRELLFWFAGFAAAAYVLYFFTKKRDIAWIGLVCFTAFYAFAGRETDAYLVGTFIAALVLAGLNSSKWLRADSALQTAWYVLLFCIAHSLKYKVETHLYSLENYTREMRVVCNGIFYFLLTVCNTAYLHSALTDKAKVLRLTKKGIAVMVLQGILFLNCMSMVDSSIWYVSLMGVASSMLVVSYSLHYSYKTKGSDHRLMVWQFIKFSLYCWVVLAMLDSPNILMNISLLLIAILAIVLGFRLGHKSVRVYGLVLSLIDVVCLVLFNIDFSDSLQLAGGIVLCGALCFVISFIYSKISKAAGMAKPEPEDETV